MNLEKFNDRIFIYNVSIADAAGSYRTLNSSSVQNLTIEDSIFSPFLLGSMTVNNTTNALEISTDSGKSIDFSGNNHDLIIVDIQQAVTDNVSNDYNNETARELFGLNTAFSINELNDPDEVTSRTTNIMNFRDVYFQYMIENSASISSAEIAGKTNSSVSLIDMNNSERSVQTGVLMRELIVKAFGTEAGKIIDAENFDLGSTKIFKTSNFNANAFQDLRSISRLHQSETVKDPCILSLDRYTKKFRNIPYSKLFNGQRDEPTKYVLETVKLTNGQAANNTSEQFTGGRGLDGLCNIIDYKISPINGNDFACNLRNLMFSTNVAADKNSFSGFSGNSLQDIYKFFSSTYVEPFQNLHSNISPAVDFDKISSNSTLRPKIVPDNKPISYSLCARNYALLNLLTTSGDNIIFSVMGSLHRRSGMFIDVISESNIADNKLSQKIIGRWLITKVSHVFTGSRYFNVIEAVKTYSIVL